MDALLSAPLARADEHLASPESAPESVHVYPRTARAQAKRQEKQPGKSLPADITVVQLFLHLHHTGISMCLSTHVMSLAIFTKGLALLQISAILALAKHA